MSMGRELPRRLLAGLVRPSDDREEAFKLSPVRFVAVGAGYRGQVNAEALASCPATTLEAVVDPDRSAAVALARKLRVPHYRALDEALENDDVEAAFITVPHDLLAPLSVRTAHSRRHVFVEKPAAVSLEEVEGVISECIRQGVELTANYWYRETPGFRLARDLVVEEDALGRLIGVESRVHEHKSLAYWVGNTGVPGGDWRASRERSGGGLLMMAAIHALDYIRFVTACDVERIYSEHGSLATPGGVEDTFSSSFRMTNGAVGSLTTSLNMRGSRLEDLTIWGDRGTMRMNPPTLELYSTRRTSLGRPGRWHRARFAGDWGKPAIRRHLLSFARQIRTGSACSVSPRDIWEMLAVATAASASSERGEAVLLDRSAAPA